jgi:hypothetical protein
MALEKVFDKADLLRFFVSEAEETTVGKFTVITPSRTLFGETDTNRYPVVAKTVAYWCERYGLALLVQSVVFPDGGYTYLPKSHPLRGRPQVHVSHERSSAALARWALDEAEVWQMVVAGFMPTEPLDLTQREREPEAQIDEDHTPTGQSVDDMFGDGEATA